MHDRNRVDPIEYAHKLAEKLKQIQKPVDLNRHIDPNVLFKQLTTPRKLSVASNQHQQQPAATLKPTTPAQPAATSKPTTPAQPAANAKPTAQSANAKPTLHAQPVASPKPTPHAQPVASPKPTLHAQPVASPKPTPHAQPVASPKPTPHAQPVASPKPTPHAQPVASPKPTLHAQPVASPKPTPHAQPVASPKPTPHAQPVANVERPKSTRSMIIIKGAKFGQLNPSKEDARIRDVIVAQNMNPLRDEKIEIPLSKYNLNYIFAKPDERDHRFSQIFGSIDPKYLPPKTDLRPLWGDIFDQLTLGSSVSNSIAYCLRYCYYRQNLGDSFTPSRLFIYYNGRSDAGYPLDEDTGLTIRDGYKSVAHHSVCSEDKWSYDPSKLTIRPSQVCYGAAKHHETFRYIRLENDINQLKKSLKDGYPISFGAAIFDNFMSEAVAKNGIVPLPDARKERRCGGHVMTIVGHDDGLRQFIVANSFGSKWGDGGFCWFPYDYILNDRFCGDFWTIRHWS
jgi:C1A family cysteine protease